MQWNDAAIILSTQAYGERAMIMRVFSEHEGLFAGMARISSKQRSTYQPGNQVQAQWKARLSEHLGTLSCELITPHAAFCLDDAMKLAVLRAACSVVERLFPERDPHPAVYTGLQELLAGLRAGEETAWLKMYVHWELTLLAQLGFGLNLSACAVTGEVEGLAYVSPRSGRAVTAEGAGAYRDQLLILPRFLAGEAGGSEAAHEDAMHGLRLTGYFLEKWVCSEMRRSLPDARARLAELLEREACQAG